MELADILFYLVLGVVGVISYASQQRAKKKAQDIERRRSEKPSPTGAAPARRATTTTATSTTDAELTLDDIFEALRGRKPLPQQAPAPVAKPATSRPVEVQPAATPRPATRRQPQRPATPRTMPSATGSEGIAATAIGDIDMTSTTQNTIEDTPARDIDWRQAVIASEILNRKY